VIDLLYWRGVLRNL